MPIYEYECASCGHTLEVIQKISDKPLTECPACHEQQLRKLVSAAAFQLKGTGWYVTDFKDKPKPADTTGKAGEASASAAAGKNDTKTGSGPAPADSGKTGTKKASTGVD